MVFITNEKNVSIMDSTKKCALCDVNIEVAYVPMKEWNVDGRLCGKCYSKKISEFYPGDHERVNISK